MSQDQRAARFPLALPLFTILSGLALQLSLLTGLLSGVRGIAFQAPWALHLLLLLSACGLGALRLRALMSSASGPLRLLSAAAGILALSYIIITGGLPVTARDALIHHLAVPKWWIEENRIFSPAWHEWSFYPMLLQLGFTGLMEHGGAALTPFYHGLYLFLLAVITAEFVSWRAHRADEALFAASLTLLVPAALRLAGTPLVDLGLAFFSGLGCFLAIQGIEERRTASLILAGASWGLALSTKFNAIPACGIFCFLWLIFLPWDKERGAVLVRWAALIALAALAVYLPWLAKNYYQTSNPLFPLFKGWFNPSAPPPPLAAADLPGGLTWLEQRRLLYHESWAEILLLPLRIFFQGRDEAPALFDGRLTPLLLFAVWPLFVRDLRYKSEKLVAWFSLAYLLVALIEGGGRVRYLGPIFAPLAALAAMGVSALMPKFPGGVIQGALPVLLIFQILWSLHYAVTSLDLGRITAYYSGRISREQYLTQAIPDYAAISYINRELPAGAKVYLLLTGNRFFYFDRPVVSPGHYSGNQVLLWLKQSHDAEEFRREFSQRGITHVMAHLARSSGHLGGNLSDEKKLLWNDFQKRCVIPRFEANGYAVWELKP